MADRYPLTLNSTSGALEELQDGDSIVLGDSEKIKLGDGGDLEIYHDGSNSYIRDTGTGDLFIRASANLQIESPSGENMIVCAENGQVNLYYDNVYKLATQSTGVIVNGRAAGTQTTDNDGSFDLSASNHFQCTPAANLTLTFTNFTAGQSGMIWFNNSGGYTISAAATTYINSGDLTTISTAGAYLLSYYSQGTVAIVTASAAITSAGA